MGAKPAATRILLTGTHLYPGARGRIAPPAAGACLVEFSDGEVAFGDLAGEILSVQAHRTAAGTLIPAKRWRIAVTGEVLRVLARSSP